MPLRPLADALAFSSLLAAGVGFALCLAISRSLETPHLFHGPMIVGLGTFVIYSVDRLRDTQRDRSTSPARTKFVERNRESLTLALAIAGILFGGLLFNAPQDVTALCIGIGGVGFFHRRLKKGASFKALYVSTAWLAACVGIPWLSAGRPSQGLWVAAILFPALLANLIASNLRDGEHPPAQAQPRTLLTIARGIALLGVGFALFGEPQQKPLAWIPLTEWVSLVGFRKDERYGHLIIDGALLVGSLLSLAHFSFA